MFWITARSEIVRPSPNCARYTALLKAGPQPWPEPTSAEPSFVALTLLLFNAVAEATDGCLIEPDGTCEHGHPSWLRHLGVI